MAAIHPITIEQGATFRLSLIWKSGGVPVDITGWTARMMVKRRYGDTAPLLSFTTENGAIVLGGAAGTVEVTGLATLTDDIPAKPGVWDIELESPTGYVKRLLEGPAVITPEVTR